MTQTLKPRKVYLLLIVVCSITHLAVAFAFPLEENSNLYPKLTTKRKQLDREPFSHLPNFLASRSGSPLFKYLSRSPDAPHVCFQPSRNLPRGVTYDPVSSFILEKIQIRDTPDGPIRSVNHEDEIRIHYTLRSMDTRVPGDEVPRKEVTLTLSDLRKLGDDKGPSDEKIDAITVTGTSSSFKVFVDKDVEWKYRNAFLASIETWSNVFPCKPQLRIRFKYIDVGGSTLAATANPFYIQGSIPGATKLDNSTVYGSVLAAAIQGVDFVPKEEMHVIVAFNAQIKWHTGKDDAPFDQYDFESVALHEVAHGLFFVGVLQGAQDQKLANFAFRDRIPSRFDRFLAQNSSASLAPCKESPEGIFDSVTSRKLRFIDPKYPEETNFGLYSPTEYSLGSTAYHQDPVSYLHDCKKLEIPFNECSSLMTEALPNGYTERSVGTPVKRIMNAMLSADVGFRDDEECRL